jgi:NAD(P)H-nitrite reductase large subunit
MTLADRSDWDVVVVGTGAAGIAAAEELGRAEPRPSVLLLSDEERLPYKRTKISKNIAQGFEREQFAQFPEEWYADQGFNLQLRARVSMLDPSARLIELQDGRRYYWGSLILAPGADPVAPLLPAELRGDPMVFLVRTAAHVEALRGALSSVRRVAVVGAGVLGVEVAEQIRRCGQEVLLIGRDVQLMPRQLNETAADRLRKILGAEGVDLRLDQPVTAFEGRRDGGFVVGLADGGVKADLLVYCVGVRPRTVLAANAGLAVDHGILVDSSLRTSHRGIFAAGDAAQHPDGTVTQLWHAAQHQGELAARNAVGGEVRHQNPPFRLKCEVFGHYFFSMNVPRLASGARRTAALPGVAAAAGPASRAGVPADEPTESFDREEEVRGPVYRCLYYRRDRLFGAVMVDDRDRAKRYEAAVREGWTRRTVRAELPLS